MRLHRRIACGLLCAALVAAFAGGAAAEPKVREVIDQQQVMDSGYYAHIAGEMVAVQTFAPGVTGYQTRLLLKLTRQAGYNWRTLETNLPGDLIVEIRPTAPSTVCVDGCNNGMTTADVPTDQVLSSAVLPTSAIADNAVLWYDVPFTSPALLIQGQVYGIYLRTDDPPPADPDTIPGTHIWRFHGDPVFDAYPAGQAIGLINYGTGHIWSVSTPRQDFDFVTYMQIVKHPR